MRVTWWGHACFAVESGGYRVVLDPFDEVPGFPTPSLTANAVLCSHEHHDHNYRPAVTLEQGGESSFAVSAMETFHDDAGGTLRGENKIHILQAEGLKLVHLGDLGHPLSPEQAAPLMGCDVLLIPVGGYFTIDAAAAAQIVRQLQPRVTIPMHYRGKDFGFDVIDTPEPFLRQFDAGLVRYLDGPTLEITDQTPRQIAVPTV